MGERFLHGFIPLVDTDVHFFSYVFKFCAAVGMVIASFWEVMGFFFTDAALGKFL